MKERLQLANGSEGYATFIDQTFLGMASHSHDELELNLVLAGKASYLFGERRVPLLAGSLVWLFPQQEHVLIDRSSGFAMWVVVFRRQLVDRFARQGTRKILRAEDPGDVFCRQLEPRQANALHELFQGVARETADFDFINAGLSYALMASWRAYQFSTDPALPTDLHPAVARAVRLISTTDNPPTLSGLARQAGLSAARLSCIFKQQTGSSLTAFRQRKGIERFLKLYQGGAWHTMTEAALMAGFGSYAQFHRVFCRVMKMNPITYKQRLSRSPK